MYNVLIYKQTGGEPEIIEGQDADDVTAIFTYHGGILAHGQKLTNGKAHHTGTGIAIVVEKVKAPKPPIKPE